MSKITNQFNPVGAIAAAYVVGTVLTAMGFRLDRPKKGFHYELVQVRDKRG